MAYYGIPSAGLAVTAGTTNDKVSVANLGGTFITAQSVYGGDGNDIISLGAVGHTATATWSGKVVNVGSGTKTYVSNWSVQPPTRTLVPSPCFLVWLAAQPD